MLFPFCARAARLQKCKAEIRTECFVYKLDSDAKKITKVHYYDKDLKSHEVRAKIFVVAGQAIESSRLLLNSKNKVFPNGMANNNGQVGKNLIFSAGGSGQGRFHKDDLNEEQFSELMQRGLFFNRSLQDWYEYEDSDKKYKGGTIDFLFEHANVISRASREFTNDKGELIWGKELQEKIQKTLTNSKILTFEVFNDWLPTDECFVSVDEKAKDKFAMPVDRKSVV